MSCAHTKVNIWIVSSLERPNRELDNATVAPIRWTIHWPHRGRPRVDPALAGVIAIIHCKLAGCRYRWNHILRGRRQSRWLHCRCTCIQWEQHRRSGCRQMLGVGHQRRDHRMQLVCTGLASIHRINHTSLAPSLTHLKIFNLAKTSCNEQVFMTIAHHWNWIKYYCAKAPYTSLELRCYWQIRNYITVNIKYANNQWTSLRIPWIHISIA